MDGFELARRVKQLADLPIIVLSAVDASEAKVSALELYAEDYVTKPFDPDELVARIQRVLRRSSVGQPADLARRRRRRGRPRLAAAHDARPATHQLTPTEARLLQVLAAVGRPGRADRRAARPRLDRCGRRRSVVPVGHRPPPAPQARGRSRPPALPAHRARHRVPAHLRHGRPPSEPERGAAAPGLWLRVFVGAAPRRPAAAPPAGRRPAPRRSRSCATLDPDLVAVAGRARLDRVGRHPRRSSTPASLADDFRALLALARAAAIRRPTRSSGDAYQQLAELARRAQPAGRRAGARDGERCRSTTSRAGVVSAIVVGGRDRSCEIRPGAAPSSTSDEPRLLPPGVYHGARRRRATAEPIGELERWASVSAAEAPSGRVEGPWGAFAVVDVAGQRSAASASSTRRGRAAPSPSPAELDLLTLVGQHAGTALEHSLLYARVRSQADELNRLAAVQADFLRGVTHDLQTPLTSIGALATELRANEAVPAAARADLESITHQADRLRRMVSQLLVASRLEAGVLTPQIEVFAVQPLVERTWARAPRRPAVRAAYRGRAAPRRRRPGPAGAGALGPARQRGEVQPGRIADRRRRFAPDGDQLAITVRDEGTGMDEETRAPGIRPVLSVRPGAHARARRQRRRPLRGPRPDGGDGRLGRGRERRWERGTAITLRLPAEPSASARVGPWYGPGPAQPRGPLQGDLQGAPIDSGTNALTDCRTHVPPSPLPMAAHVRGQALVEFALVLPLLALLLVMALDFGRVFFGWVALQNAARIGANYAGHTPNLLSHRGRSRRVRGAHPRRM